MAWNAHAHGSPTHFLARVSAFRRSIGAAELPLYSKVLGYPYALATETPEAALLGAFGIAGLVVSRSFRSRWRWPAAATTAVLVFLIAGDLGDGAPTHHPERALCILWWVLIACGADALAMARCTPQPVSHRRPIAHSSWNIELKERVTRRRRTAVRGHRPARARARLSRAHDVERRLLHGGHEAATYRLVVLRTGCWMLRFQRWPRGSAATRAFR
jgi:hypothetical protein